jgi:formate dehydrogenase subunit gamma
MAATTSRSEVPVELHRFDKAERIAHWANATLFLVCMATAAALYIGPLSAAVGRRELVRTIHVYAGLALPIPLIVAMVGRWGDGFRRDLTRLNRWTPDDIKWLRSWSREPLIRADKFNPGQKLNAAFTGGAIVLMLATGSIMHWFDPFPLSWRTGATFVHDWLAFFLFLTITGHILYALRDRDALRSMVSGSIPASWARSHAPRWYGELVDDVDRSTERDAGGQRGDVGVLHADAPVAHVPADEPRGVRTVNRDLP